MANKIDLQDVTNGSWNRVEKTSRIENHKGKVITIIALVAIGAVAGGALLIYFKVNALTGWCLIGAGGFLTAADIVIGVYLCRPKADEGMVENVTYKVVSWDVSTSLKALENDPTPAKNWRNTIMTAMKKRFTKGKKDDDTTEEDFSHPSKIVQQAYKQFNEADIICLQETSAMSEDEFKLIWPENYAYFTYHNDGGVGSSVVWNSARFKLLDHATLQYDAETLRSENLVPDTVVLLQDLENNAKICVGSVHIRSFLLKTAKQSDERTLATQHKRGGDNQLNYILNTMELANADIYVLAGNFSATTELYKKRFQFLEDAGYTSNGDSQATTSDPNLTEKDETTPLAVRVDHIFASSAKGGISFVKIEEDTEQPDNSDEPLPTELPDNTSEHLPIAANINFLSA